MTQGRSWGLRWLTMGALFVAGLLTRGCHIDSRFTHPDEPIATGLNRWLDHSWDTNWKLASLPAEFDYEQYNFSSYHYAVHFWSKLAVPFMPKAWQTERDGVVLLRTFSVFCGALVIVWAFLLGERLGGWVTGLAGAILMLANPQLVADGHYARAEAMLTWLTLVVVGLAWGGSRLYWRLAASALLVGFMIAAKVTMGLMLVAPLWVAWQMVAGEKATGARFKRLSIALAAAGSFTVVGFAAGAPGAVAHLSVFFHGVQVLANQYGGFHPPHSEVEGGRVAVALGKFYLVTVGVFGLALVLVSLVDWIRRRDWTSLVLLVLPFFVYFGYFATKRVFFERNLSHVLPLGLIAAGAGISWLAALIVRQESRARGVVTVLLLGLVATPGVTVTWPLLMRAFSGIDAVRSEQYQREIRAKYAELEWRPVSMIFRDDLAAIRQNFSRDRKPLLVQFPVFNDSYSRHYRAVLEQEFVTYDAGEGAETLSYLPCSTLTVYHGPKTVFKIITGRR